MEVLLSMDPISSRSLQLQRGLSGTTPVATSGGFPSVMYNDTTGEYQHPNNSDHEHNNTTSSAPIGDGLVFLLVAGVLLFIIVWFLLGRDYQYCKQGIHVWPRTVLQWLFHDQQRMGGGGPSPNGSVGDSYEADRALAEELQRQLNEEGRETDRMEKRKERERWYQYYMENSLMIVEKKDLFYGKDLESGMDVNDVEGDDQVRDNDNKDDVPSFIRGNNVEKPITTKYRGRGVPLGDASEDELVGDTEDEEIGDSEKRISTSCLVICDEHDVDARLYLTLPPKQTDKGLDNNETGINSESDSSQTSCKQPLLACLGVRHVDGQCALCIDDYVEGDTVVWSNLDCTHAFHKECVLQWLSKGKKRCPVCRDWFVPGARIEDQKQAHGVAWEQALERMQRRENEEETQEEESATTEFDSAELRRPQQEEEHLDHVGGEQGSSENTEPTEDFTDENNADHPESQCNVVVETMMNAMSNKEDVLPPRKGSEESEIDERRQSDESDEEPKVITNSSTTTPPTCSRSGMMAMVDLESQL